MNDRKQPVGSLDFIMHQCLLQGIASAAVAQIVANKTYPVGQHHNALTGPVYRYLRYIATRAGS